MNSITWKKLNFKTHNKRIVVLHAPDSFEPEIDNLEGVKVYRNVRSSRGAGFLLAFVTKRSEILDIAATLHLLAQGDVIVWFCYPKGSSRNYTCDFNRDSGWEPLGAAGFEGVRQVAIDEDWSAIRFRRVQFIQTMKRDPKRARTRPGKVRSRKLRG